jgi:hypothetical protein
MIANVSIGYKDYEVPDFIPTGALEPVIPACGDRQAITWIVNLQCNNKGGKTAMGAAGILRNIIWDNDKEYFDYPNFNNWPFLDDDGKPIKRGRIVGTPQNVSDTGPIQTEIKKWWPKSRYNMQKNMKKYYSIITTDSGWLFDVMTFRQDSDEFEGPLISIHWVDEPAKPNLIGAFTSRHSKGGILLFTQTPKGAAPMLEVFDDLARDRNKKKGMKIITVSSTMEDNSSETGKLNSKGTKRGLMTNEEIEAYIAQTPLTEIDARIHGKNLAKEGKIYGIYNDIVHARMYEWDDPRFKKANCYCSIDPHEEYYPFISWWAVMPPNNFGICDHVCYNEWPNYEYFNEYYDVVRYTSRYNKTYEQLSKIIKLLDMTEFGFNIVGRAIDPGFSKKTEIQAAFLKYDLTFDAPPRERIETQRNTIQTLLHYDEQLDITPYNTPKAFIMPHCRNMRRCVARHYWEVQEKLDSRRGKTQEVEAEKYKDALDTWRNFEALISNKQFKEVTPQFKKKPSIITSHLHEEWKGLMKDVAI